MEYTKLLDICEVYQPKTIATKDFIPNGSYYVYGANGIIGRYNKYNHKDSEIVMACRGATCGSINVTQPKSWVNGNAMVIRPNGLFPISKKYLRYCLLAIDKNSIISGTAQPQITRNNLKTLKIPVCNMSEQSRIVSRIEEMFSQLDSGIETLKQTKTQLAVYRQAVLKEAFSSITNGKQVTLSQCLVDKPRNGYSPKAVDYPTRYKNLTLTATTSGHFIDDCYKYIDIQIDDDSYLWVKHNDILIQRANTLEYVGTAVVYTGEDDKYVYPDLMMKCRTINDINPHYIVYQLQSQSTRQYYRRNATGTAGSMPKINQSVVMNTPIIITNNIEQNEIVKSIEAKFSVCDQIEKSIDIALQQSEALRQSILKKAFEENI